MTRFVAAALWMLAILLALASACGGEEPDAGSTEETVESEASVGLSAAAVLTEAEQEYLDRVRDAWPQIIQGSEVRGAIRRMSTKEQLFALLKRAEPHKEFQRVLEAVERLPAPLRFKSDHDRHLELLKDMISMGQVIAGAIDDQDPVAFSLAFWQQRTQAALVGLELSQEYCSAIVGYLDIPPPYRPCRSGEPLPGGEYGRQLAETLVRFDAEFMSRNIFFLPLLTDDEVIQALAVMQPGVIELVEETLDSVQKLEAPAEFQSGHAQLVQYLEDQLSAARSVPLAAGERGGIREQLRRSDEVFCAARLQMPRAMWLFAGVHFWDWRGVCSESRQQPPQPP